MKRTCSELALCGGCDSEYGTFGNSAEWLCFEFAKCGGHLLVSKSKIKIRNRVFF